MVNLKAQPFNLSDEQIQWVEDTIAGMTLDEKVGQLFTLMKAGPVWSDETIENWVNTWHQGGLRWQGEKNADSIYKMITTFQKYSKIPLLVAANCDDGGNGAVPEGTFVATAAECGAGEGYQNAYNVGYTAAREAGACGVNWMYNPVADIYMNWRNTIVNTRSFGDNVDVVVNNCRAYIKGIHDGCSHMAACCKHFPGDGVEELDQHLALGVNTLSVEEWDATFRKVYQTLIDEGLESIMVGHIALPAMSRKLRPGIAERDIMPATLAPELLTDLLRGEMGFNGLITTDASHMAGITTMSTREKAVPGCIAAGCDLFLFMGDNEEDFTYMKNGILDGTITEERLSDALHRILGMKAKLELYKEENRIPDPALKGQVVACEEHKQFTVQAADTCITLVKDTDNNLPINPEKQKNAFLVYVQSTPTTKAYNGDPTKQVVIEELERAGFNVDVCPNYHDLEVENGISPMNMVTMMSAGSHKAFKEKYDVVFLVINVKGYAQENWVRLRWSCNHSRELPWYNLEVPTIGISLNYTNHLIDVPQLHTFINAYGPNRTHVRACIEKIIGKSEFKGTANDTVFCGRWDARL